MYAVTLHSKEEVGKDSKILYKTFEVAVPLNVNSSRNELTTWLKFCSSLDKLLNKFSHTLLQIPVVAGILQNPVVGIILVKMHIGFFPPLLV